MVHRPRRLSVRSGRSLPTFGEWLVLMLAAIAAIAVSAVALPGFLAEVLWLLQSVASLLFSGSFQVLGGIPWLVATVAAWAAAMTACAGMAISGTAHRWSPWTRVGLWATSAALYLMSGALALLPSAAFAVFIWVIWTIAAGFTIAPGC